MNHLNSLIFSWGSPMVQITLLALQIYTYRRTRHYSLVLLAAASAMGLLSSALIKILSSNSFVFRLAAIIIDSTLILYAGYLILGIWGAAALFQSYRRLTDANKAPVPSVTIGNP
jgi:hypothetical protein